MKIPNDPMILLSFINTQLRDKYPSLDAFCEDNELTARDIEEKLSAAGFVYRPETNSFAAKKT